MLALGSPEIRDLTVDEIERTAFRHLLWLAAEVDSPALDAIIRDELPSLVVRGIVEFGAPVAFLAVNAATDRVSIEYIAVAESARSLGYGTALVQTAQRIAHGRPVYAETDDDAVDFYRRLGFHVSLGDADLRWPERQRYICVLG